MSEIRMPVCPLCAEAPQLVVSIQQAFCANEKCGVLCWDMTDDPAVWEGDCKDIQVIAAIWEG